MDGLSDRGSTPLRSIYKWKINKCYKPFIYAERRDFQVASKSKQKRRGNQKGNQRRKEKGFSWIIVQEEPFFCVKTQDISDYKSNYT